MLSDFTLYSSVPQVHHVDEATKFPNVSWHTPNMLGINALDWNSCQPCWFTTIEPLYFKIFKTWSITILYFILMHSLYILNCKTLPNTDLCNPGLQQQNYISFLPFWYHIIWKPDMETEESVLKTMVRAELVVLLAGGGVYPQNVPIRGACSLGPL